ncbi:uncharacterized protein [Clytia hemisphaerica]|uniref:Ubiquitin-like domain-containing protein n=1 Tax=Clytia hemisphaerica TaxID=252671 RepID=A0A7M5UIG3_9CNID
MDKTKSLDQTFKDTLYLEEGISARCTCGILLENCEQCSKKQQLFGKSYYRCPACNGMTRLTRDKKFDKRCANCEGKPLDLCPNEGEVRIEIVKGKESRCGWLYAGKVCCFNVPLSSTSVSDLKDSIEEMCRIPRSAQRLSEPCSKESITDTRMLSSFNLVKEKRKTVLLVSQKRKHPSETKEIYLLHLHLAVFANFLDEKTTRLCKINEVEMQVIEIRAFGSRQLLPFTNDFTSQGALMSAIESDLEIPFNHQILIEESRNGGEWWECSKRRDEIDTKAKTIFIAVKGIKDHPDHEDLRQTCQAFGIKMFSSFTLRYQGTEEVLKFDEFYQFADVKKHVLKKYGLGLTDQQYTFGEDKENTFPCMMDLFLKKNDLEDIKLILHKKNINVNLIKELGNQLENEENSIVLHIPTKIYHRVLDFKMTHQEEIDIPVKEMELRLGDYILEDSKTLDDYGIRSEATLKVRKKPFEICIELSKEHARKDLKDLQNLHKANGFKLDKSFIKLGQKVKVQDWNTIGEVKECFVERVTEIECAENIVLFLNGEPLDDNKTIGDYGIKSYSCIAYRQKRVLRMCLPFATKK